MARSNINAQDTPGGYIEDGTILSGGGSDDAEGNELDLTGRELILVRNNSGGDTATFLSVDNVRGRQADIAAAISAQQWGIFGPFSIDGWQQDDGKLNIDFTTTATDIFNIRLPSEFKAT